MNFDTFLKVIPTIKTLELPGQEAQFKMSPPFRLELLERQKEQIKNAKQAAVMALFYPDVTNQTRFVLTLRKTYKGVHSAQVGFPGGKLEANETLEQAALRETHEEIGVSQNTIEVLKKMTPIYIPPSNFYAHLFIGLTKTAPHFIKQDTEVEAIIEVPLAHFLDQNNSTTKTIETSYVTETKTPAYQLNGHIVWGATAMMLSEVKVLLEQL